MVEKIAIEIALEGGENIKRQLADIGEAGQKAFLDISKSAEQAGGFKNLNPDVVTKKLEEFGVTGVESINKIRAAVQQGIALENVVQGVSVTEAAFSALGAAAVAAGAALGVIASAVAAAGGALFPLASSAADVAQSLGQVADASNSGIQAVSNLASVFADAGVNTKEFSASMTKLAEDSNRAFESMGTNAQQSADRITQAEQRMEDAFDRVTEAGNRQREMETQRKIQIEQSAIASERSALASEKARAATANLTEEYKGYIAAAEEKIRRHERGVRALQDEANETRAHNEAIRNSHQAIRAMTEAQRAAHELDRVRANDIATLVQAWKDFAQSIDGAAAALAKADFANRVQALKAVLGQIGALGGDINARMLFLSEILSKLPIDKALELGKALGLTRQEVLLLHKDYENLIREMVRKHKLGLGITPEDQKALDDFTEAWNRLKTIIDDLANKIGAKVAPAFTFLFNLMTAGIEKAVFGFQTLMSWLEKLGQTPAGQLLITMFNILVTVIGTVISMFATLESWLVQIAASRIGEGLSLAFSLINGAINLVIQAIITLIGWFDQLAASPVGQAIGAAFAWIRDAIAAAIVWLDNFVTSLKNITWETISDIALSAWNALIDAIGSAASAVGNFASSIANIVWDTISNIGVAAWNALTAAIQQAFAALAAFLGLQGRAGGAPAGGGAPAKASGGVIGGRGSGTSDSNLAWVSRGEHIMPARAVAQPGVLAFLEALRRSGGNLAHVLDGMGRFALGGLVPRPALAFADGGPVGGMSNVTIQFPGLPDIGGLRASTGTIEELRRAAAMAQVRSGGRKPSRYS